MSCAAKTARLQAAVIATALVLSAVFVPAPSIAQVSNTSPSAPPDQPAAPAPPEATGQSALSISPAIVDNVLDAGKSFVTIVTVRNVTQQPMAVKATTRDFVPQEKVDPAYAAVYDSSPWFTIDEPDLLLLPQQDRQVKITVNTPPNAEPGGHYATVYFEAFVPHQATEGATTIINARVGVLVLMTIRGAIREHVVPVGSVHVQKFQTEAGPTSLSYSLQNDGNVHVLPFNAHITITNVFGKKVKQLDTPLGILLPDTTRSYEATWEHGLRFGFYKAQASARAGSAQIELKPKSTWFFLCPLVLVIPIGVAILVALLTFFIGRHRRNRKRRARMKALAALGGSESEEEEEAKQASDEPAAPDDDKRDKPEKSESSTRKGGSEETETTAEAAETVSKPDSQPEKPEGSGTEA